MFDYTSVRYRVLKQCCIIIYLPTSTKPVGVNTEARQSVWRQWHIVW